MASANLVSRTLIFRRSGPEQPEPYFILRNPASFLTLNTPEAIQISDSIPRATPVMNVILSGAGPVNQNADESAAAHLCLGTPWGGRSALMAAIHNAIFELALLVSEKCLVQHLVSHSFCGKEQRLSADQGSQDVTGFE